MKENHMQTTNKTFQNLVTADIVENEPVRQKVRIHKFTGKEKHFISLVEASLLTRRHRDKAGRGAIKGGFFGRKIYEKILAQEGCVGVRNYFAALNDGTPTVVLVGVNEGGDDMIRGVLGDDAFPCPPFQGCYNLLNSGLEDYLVPLMKKENVFTGKENHCITLAEARHFVDNFRKVNDADVVKGGYFSREIYEKILSQEDCVGIRNYFAETTDCTPTLVVVGVDSRGHDQIHGVVGDDMILCPPHSSSEVAL